MLKAPATRTVHRYPDPTPTVVVHWTSVCGTVTLQETAVMTVAPREYVPVITDPVAGPKLEPVMVTMPPPAVGTSLVDTPRMEGAR